MGFQSELDTGTVLIDREELAALRTQLSAEQCHVVHLKDELLDAKRNEERVVDELNPEHRDGENYLVWHDGEWKCAHYEDGVGVWVGWWVTGGDNRQPMRPNPVYYRPLPPDLDGES